MPFCVSGPSMLVVDERGECGGGGGELDGYFYRETRYLRALRVEIDGVRPWLCGLGAAAPDELELVYVHPELSEFGGGGSGQSGDAVAVDEHGVPFRALDLRVTYRARV